MGAHVFRHAVCGVLGGVNFEEAIGALPSLVRFEVEREEGDHIDATVDLASCAGYAHLVHPDADAVEPAPVDSSSAPPAPVVVSPLRR